MQVQLLSCLGSEAYSNWEPWDKKVTYKSLTLLKKKKKKVTQKCLFCVFLFIIPRTLAGGPWVQETTSALVSSPTTVSLTCRSSVWTCWVTHSYRHPAVSKVRRTKISSLRLRTTFGYIVLTSCVRLRPQVWTSASETSVRGASGSERHGGWRWATSLLGSVIRSAFYLLVFRFVFTSRVEESNPYPCSFFQISERVFTLETQQGQQVAHDEEVLESGLELCCVPAPDYSPVWRWRVRDGALETR